MKKAIFCAAACALLLLSAGCGASPAAAGSAAAGSAAESTAAASASTSDASAPAQSADQSAAPAKSLADADHQAFFDQVTDYILNGQSDLPEAEKLQWSESFLKQVDQEPTYQDYLTAGGAAEDVQAFAAYLTENAPCPDNWQTLFETDFASAYGEKVVRYVDLGSDFCQVYVEIDGNEVPFVAVNTRTGWYHG
jgi:hypothetical protein